MGTGHKGRWVFTWDAKADHVVIDHIRILSIGLELACNGG